MARGPTAGPGTFLCFAAMVLLLFASVSAPTWNLISFLNVGNPDGSQLRYGVFGFTGSKTSIGYDFSLDSLNTTTIHNLTKTLILHPIACGLAGIAFLSGLCGVAGSRAGAVMMTLWSSLAAIVTLVAWVIDMVLFGIARSRYRDEDIPAQYGNANWMVLGAFVALIIGFCCAAIGSFTGCCGRRRNGPATAY